MRRGDIVEVNLDPVIGSEANKVRPAVIVSNNSANESVTTHRRGVVAVVPITSNVTRVYPFQVALEADESRGLKKTSKAQAEQIRSVDFRRIRRIVGQLTPAELESLDAALRIHLAL